MVVSIESPALSLCPLHALIHLCYPNTDKCGNRVTKDSHEQGRDEAGPPALGGRHARCGGGACTQEVVSYRGMVITQSMRVWV